MRKHAWRGNIRVVAYGEPEDGVVLVIQPPQRFCRLQVDAVRDLIKELQTALGEEGGRAEEFPRQAGSAQAALAALYEEAKHWRPPPALTDHGTP